jgi:peroxisomal membrane protein 4
MDNLSNILLNFTSLSCPFCNHDNCLISSIRGFRNGLYYGGKVRLVHSIVMEILFGKSDNIVGKIKNIIRPTTEHALNLGKFALIYKSVVCILKRLFNSDNKIINFIAGVIGAFFVWKNKSNVNMQIMLYLLSRNILAISNIISEKYMPNFQYGFSITSILVWGIVMFLFENNPKALQNSLKSSMDFIYKDSDTLKNWKDFIPFYIPTSW